MQRFKNLFGEKRGVKEKNQLRKHSSLEFISSLSNYLYGDKKLVRSVLRVFVSKQQVFFVIGY